ncbi:MAG: diphthine synthase [Candidatus Micrarchaeota archaeon]|nr:diphthine synthase [Candidatus Micrarchaeota archaeon]MDE1847632.1 diphthine synthase [Candidatus Micrarchaeota archaeon]MDE1864453.1 diphthine synthase [Candidatus Micrarchaeota archaeon]
MLILTGTGVNNRDISQLAIEQIKQADELLLDLYTNHISKEELSNLSMLCAKEPKLLSRSDLEENAGQIVERAKRAKIAILVSGDPLIATTHHTILDLAAKAHVEYMVCHSSSIFSAAIGESGLDIYKFGPTTTITFWSEKYRPVSFIDAIKKNIDNAQHTLALFDYHYEEQRRMRLGEAIVLLHAADEQRGHGLMDKERMLLVMGDIGKQTQQIKYVQLGAVDKEVLKGFEGKTLCMIVPGKLSFAEEDALKRF